MKNNLINSLDLPKKVGILYSEVKREYFPTESQYITEKDAKKDAKLIGKYLEKMGVTVTYYEGTPHMVSSLSSNKPDMVINLVASINGQEYLSASIPGILEALDIPYTGAGILGESLAYNKFLVKDLLQNHGIPVPNFQLVSDTNYNLGPHMRYPIISKLNEIHGAVEITSDSVSFDDKHLKSRIKFLMNTYKQPVLLEEFIAGREFTAILLEGLNKKVYLAEKDFVDSKDGHAFATFDVQWTGSTDGTYAYIKYTDTHLVELVKKAFDVLRMSDYGKFDIRFDQSGRYYFIDSNSNPAFGPKETDCALPNILDMYGISFNEILRRLLLNTMRDASGKSLLPIV